MTIFRGLCYRCRAYGPGCTRAVGSSSLVCPACLADEPPPHLSPGDLQAVDDSVKPGFSSVSSPKKPRSRKRKDS